MKIYVLLQVQFRTVLKRGCLQKHIDTNAVCYHFDESGGSIEGLYYKIKYIDNHGECIKNALFIIDHQLLDNLTQDGSLFIIPPALVDNSNFLTFQMAHIRNWLNPNFLYKYVKYSITGTYEKNMGNMIDQGLHYPYYRVVTNEIDRHIQDSLIYIGEYYTEERKTVFRNKQKPSIGHPVLDNSIKISRLVEMREIMERHNTDYKIVISPLYNQVKINPDDYQKLCDIFGKHNIYDFSGVNKWTSDYHNYYEDSHYLPCVATEIMDTIYSR